MSKAFTRETDGEDDDIALPDLPQARGVAGTLFVHKIAGHLAESGADLAAVTEAAERVIAGTKSIGMSLDTCTVPGSAKESRIAPGMAELGLGIHGEPGVEQVSFTSAQQAMAAMASSRLENPAALTIGPKAYTARELMPKETASRMPVTRERMASST